MTRNGAGTAGMNWLVKTMRQPCICTRESMRCSPSTTRISQSEWLTPEWFNFNQLIIIAPPFLAIPSLDLIFVILMIITTTIARIHTMPLLITEFSFLTSFFFSMWFYLNCTHPVTNNPKYVDTASCLNWHREGYIYAIASDLMAEDFQVGCHVKLVSPTSWWGLHTNETSYAVIHRALVYGFEISWLHLPCQDLCGDPESCFFDSSREELRCSHYCRSFLGYERIPCGKVKDLTNLLVSYVINCEIFVLPSNCMILRYLSCCN